eukprot:5490730-Amphidinium_carterae.2
MSRSAVPKPVDINSVQNMTLRNLQKVFRSLSPEPHLSEESNRRSSWSGPGVKRFSLSGTQGSDNMSLNMMFVHRRARLWFGQCVRYIVNRAQRFDNTLS